MSAIPNKHLNLILPAVLLILTLAASLLAQSRATTRPTNSHPRIRTITVKATGETISSFAEQFDVTSEALAQANGLEVNARLRKGQRLVIPAASLSPAKPAPQSGVPIGQRIVFSDGATLDVDDVWKQGDTTWYRSHGTSQSTTREIRGIETRYRPVTTTASAAPTVKEVAKTPAPVSNWIYLVDGARIRVDDVREVSDGAWYNRANLTIFLARERIARIERDVTNAPDMDSRDRGWSSGSSSIDQLIRTHATRVGIDPYLVFLVIEQESHFHPRVVSPKGARGLMQLMPGTARRFGVTRPFDAAENIRGGTQYLKQLLTMFGGRVDLALASYNAGEGRVLDYGNRVPPFKETRDYVKRISSRYRKQAAEGSGANAVPLRRQ
jgi:soluble lytic murein transglycosylase-like protein